MFEKDWEKKNQWKSQKWRFCFEVHVLNKIRNIGLLTNFSETSKIISLKYNFNITFILKWLINVNDETFMSKI